jgi:hypothetical protein
MTINAPDMSGKAGFVTGQILHVDGGYTAQ